MGNQRMQSKAQMNQEAYDLLVNSILKPTSAKFGKDHDQLVWDECKRYIQACIDNNIRVIT